MLFNSFEFLLFFPIVCIIYFLIQKVSLRNYFLLAASYFFYMGWEPVYALLLLSSTVITYTAAILMEKWQKQRKLIFISSLVANLLILFFFKYFNFAAENLAALMDAVGMRFEFTRLKVLLPVGISFYIFQALGYSIDVYRGDVKPERNFFTYALFVSFFPQLVAGPIERSRNLLPQFYQRHEFDSERAMSGINLMLWGYFLKLVIADRCAIYVDSVYNNISMQNGGSSLLASFLFCFQLYGDFAGYSYIAIGCARVMGFKLMDNFMRPYFFSVSIQDYWKRNHISLTTWFMDYVYYPMVGSSTSLAWWCLSIFITFLISGFWHGAAWTYVACFAIFGFYLVVCNLKFKAQNRFEKKHKLKKKQWWLWLNRFLTFVLVMVALVFFRAHTITEAAQCFENIFCNMQVPMLGDAKRHLFYAALGLIALFVAEYSIEYKKVDINATNSLRVYSLCGIAMLCSILFFGVFDGGQFIYFQF